MPCFTAYVARLIALRQEHAVLRWPSFLHGGAEPVPGIQDIAWFDEQGGGISIAAWNDPQQRTLILRRVAANGDGTVTILTLLLNPTGEDRCFRLPPPDLASLVVLDSASPEAEARAMIDGALTVAAHSAVLVLAQTEAAP